MLLDCPQRAWHTCGLVQCGYTSGGALRTGRRIQLVLAWKVTCRTPGFIRGRHTSGRARITSGLIAKGYISAGACRAGGPIILICSGVTPHTSGFGAVHHTPSWAFRAVNGVVLVHLGGGTFITTVLVWDRYTSCRTGRAGEVVQLTIKN